MDRLYDWKVRRSGSGMSIKHRCGRIVGVSDIVPIDGEIVAIAADGRRFVLAVL